jgi:hypothetical protein
MIVVRMRQQMLSQKSLAIVISVWGSHHGMDVISCRDSRWLHLTKGTGQFMIKFDKNNRTLNPVIKHRSSMVGPNQQADMRLHDALKLGVFWLKAVFLRAKSTF